MWEHADPCMRSCHFETDLKFEISLMPRGESSGWTLEAVFRSLHWWRRSQKGGFYFRDAS